MHKVEISYKGEKNTVMVLPGTVLSSIFEEGDIKVEHPCGFRGTCKKCTVLVNGKEELSCRYKVFSDIEVCIPEKKEIVSVVGAEETKKATHNMCMCFDIGTTTLALALVSLDEKRIVDAVTCTNPQRAYGADVMSRIDYSAKHGVEKMHEAVIEALNEMITTLCNMYALKKVETLYVAGNTTMLHIFFNTPCESMGYSPYTPVFTESKEVKGELLGIKNTDTVVSVEGISAFVGADIVAGLGYTKMPEKGKYSILVDLGTNAEVALYSADKVLCTAAAAGPCFEGVNITCGMSAKDGAVYSYKDKEYKVIGDTEPEGICATGLIDIIAEFIKSEVIDETGFMECSNYSITEKVSVNQMDIRQFQLAKSAIASAIMVLMKKANIEYEDIENVYVSGGFSGKMNMDNAVVTGLFPKEFKGKFNPINNSSLQGCVKYACERNDLSQFVENAQYVDLSADEYFQELFIENMMF